MVDFKQHLTNLPCPNPPGVQGEILTWRKHHTTGEVRKAPAQYRIGPQPGVRITFELIEGGVTGHERVVLIDHQNVQLSTLNNLLNQPYWCCCFGTKGAYDEQRITRSELRRVLVPLLEDANRPGKCWKCEDQEGILAEDPLLLRVADRYEYQYWCADCHSTRDKEQSFLAAV